MPDLNLQKHVVKAFDFLASEGGFRCTEQSAYHVRYESPTAFVNVAHDGRRSYELELFVGRLGLEPREQTAYTIGEIVRLNHAPDAKDFALFRANSEEQLVRHLETIARALKAYGKDILLGKPESFTELARHRRRESAVYALERDLRQARPVAQAAWEARDYAAVVKAFGHLRHALTPSEAERLEFAEEQLRPK